MSSPAIFRPFESRNYRLFFSGQFVSLMGNWMTNTAIVWLAYDLTGSSFWLGMIGFVSQLPSFLLTPIAGVVADRVNRYRLFVLTQILSMVQSFCLAYFAITGNIRLPHLLILGAFQGFINAFDMPTRQTLVLEFVGKKEYLPSAIALNSSMFNLTRLIGPSIAGFILAGFGAGICFALNTVSFLAVLGALFAMKITPHVHTTSHKHPLVELMEGFHYAYHFVPIRTIIGILCAISFFGFPMGVLSPVYAQEIFHGNATTLGFMMGATGLGALCGAIYLGMRKRIKGIRLVISAGGCMIGGGLVALTFLTWFPLALFFMAVVGAGGVLVMASCNTALQNLSDDDKRGRIMSIFTMAFAGMIPLGCLFIGALADRIGARYTVFICALACFASIYFFYRQIPETQRILQEHFRRKQAIALDQDLPPQAG